MTTEAPPRRNRLVVGVLALACGLIGAMWVYAFGFASKESINKVDDREWARQAEEVCASARRARIELADFEYVEEPTIEAMQRRAGIVQRSTDILEEMLDDITDPLPSDDKGREIVPLWEADYRTYLADRRAYADDLMVGENRQFSETKLRGIPISEKLETFASDNEMESCAPPRDLVS